MAQLSVRWKPLTTSLLLGALLISCIKRAAPTELEVSAKQEAGGGAIEKPAPTFSSKDSVEAGAYGTVESEDVLGGEGIRAFRVFGATERIEARWLPATGQPFHEFIRAKVVEPSQNAWDVQLRASNATVIQSGDVLLGTVYVRTEWAADESGEGKTEAVFELASDPWTKSVTYPMRSPSNWRKVLVPFVAKGNYQPGEAQFAFRMGFENQTLELGGITLENFGKKLALADLPRTERSYPGRQLDAAWRADAQARIDKYRKADLKIVVQDQSGKPTANAQVQVQLKRHAFNFGTAAPADIIVAGGNEHEKFKQVLTDSFNMVTIENNLKWQPLAGDWSPEYTLARAQKAVQWLNGRNFRVRGHVLVWPGWQNLPARLRRHEKDPARLRQEVSDHIKTVVLAMKGQVVDWDVLNEPFTNHELLDILGSNVMVEWFKLARSLDPKPKLFINDFAILNGGGGTNAHRDHYEQMIQLLVDNNAPVDGIGFQGHFGTALTGPENVYKLLERYGKFNKSMIVTEYDLLVEDEQLAADFTRDFYTILFSHPLVESIVMWGFWDARHWHKNAPMYRADWTEKPAGREYRRLIKQEWNTRENGKTDAEGIYPVRGFLGDYEIVVTSKKKIKIVKTTIKKTSEGASARIIIKI